MSLNAQVKYNTKNILEQAQEIWVFITYVNSTGSDKPAPPYSLARLCILTHLSRMEFHTVINWNWNSPFLF